MFTWGEKLSVILIILKLLHFIWRFRKFIWSADRNRMLRPNCGLAISLLNPLPEILICGKKKIVNSNVKIISKRFFEPLGGFGRGFEDTVLEPCGGITESQPLTYHFPIELSPTFLSDTFKNPLTYKSNNRWYFSVEFSRKNSVERKISEVTNVLIFGIIKITLCACIGRNGRLTGCLYHSLLYSSSPCLKLYLWILDYFFGARL